MKKPFRLFVVLVFAALVLLTIAAIGSSVQIANALATVAILVSPLFLKYVKVDGPTMLAIAYAVAFVIAAVSGYASGEFKPDFSSLPALLGSATVLFGVQQLVFGAFKDSEKVGPLLK